VEQSRAVGVTPRLFLLVVAGAVLAAGLLGGLFALVRGQTNSSIALAYYILGSIVVIAGFLPGGGAAGLRARTEQRRPTGASGYALPSLLLGAVLVGVGVLVDVYHPF
jgi:MFS superfamily sulfate permease-like transporter